ncbi:MAG: carboxypeptidase M32 [Xanthobacteraceae bacterium]|nr:carboxypeptidase M32 [Xanthobacteraceae bacterium]MBV9631803.1 carboxypeptidase M32 [Xanthobacteraceae bacterium]
MSKPSDLAGGTKPRPSAAIIADLKHRLAEIYDLNAASSVLTWDEATYMPAGGAAARGRQVAILRRLAHERLTDPALGRLLDRLEQSAGNLSADDANLLRVTRRDFEKAIRVPAEYVARANAHASASYNAWCRARPANDFAAIVPFLEKTLELSREYASFFAPFDHIAAPMIDDADEGVTTATIRLIFTELRHALVPMVRAISEQPSAADAWLDRPFDEEAQLGFGLKIAAQMGYDLERGRLDKTRHPFCTKFASGDVRITTRVRENDIRDALFSTLHEAGHAMYEQGVNAAYEGTPLGSGVSSGVHESQSRLWENVVARSRPFWEHYYPTLQQLFADQLGAVPLDMFYRAINKVEPSLIRTDADEVTYNLHIMLRFDLEVGLLEGRLRVVDLPEAWRAGMEADLGIAPPDDRDGCLQDVHWYAGNIGGAFQSYTIGNILSAQFFAAATKAHPEIPTEIANGQFGTLHSWLTDNLYGPGRALKPDEIVARSTGSPMTMAPYLAYLRKKYGELYQLPAS